MECTTRQLRLWGQWIYARENFHAQLYGPDVSVTNREVEKSTSWLLTTNRLKINLVATNRLINELQINRLKSINCNSSINQLVATSFQLKK